MDGSKESPIVFFEADGSGPHDHVCQHSGPTLDRIRDWLFKEKCYGLSPESVAVVERLIEDLR